MDSQKPRGRSYQGMGIPDKKKPLERILGAVARREGEGQGSR